MRIGISLPWHYAAGIYDRDRASRTVYRDCSSAAVFLEKLRKQGCSSIELRHWVNDLTEKDLAASYRNITEAGLGYSIHGDIQEDHDNKDIFESFPWLRTAMEGLVNRSGKELVVTIHPVKKENGDVAELKTKTEAILVKYCNDIEKHSIPLKIAYENQRLKGFEDPALKFTSISESVKKINRKELGTCWDMGHSYANFLKNSFSELPDSDFLKYAIHTHIHDLSDSSGATHWPLTCGNTPVGKYIKLLKDNNYSGLYNLEFSTERFDMLNVEEYILKSIDILKGYIK